MMDRFYRNMLRTALGIMASFVTEFDRQELDGPDQEIFSLVKDAKEKLFLAIKKWEDYYGNEKG